MRKAYGFRPSGAVSMKTIFVSGYNRQECDYWAEVWGFKRNEYIAVTKDIHLRGIINTSKDAVVFICGSQGISTLVMNSLSIAGFNTYVDAHDLDTNFEPRSALDLLP